MTSDRVKVNTEIQLETWSRLQHIINIEKLDSFEELLRYFSLEYFKGGLKVEPQ
jgi:hypothetical protein